jgi:prephenate dehydrogenase
MRRILIAGAGRMGSWFVSLLSDRYEVAVYDPVRVAEFRYEGVSQLTNAAEAGQFKPDLLLNCVSIEATIDSFTEMIPYLPAGCVLSDIASVKGELIPFYRQSGMRFVSVHPMFGPTFASFRSLRGLSAILIDESDEEGKDFFRDIFQKEGIRIYERSFAGHDRIMAEVLSIPMISALLFSAGAEGLLPHGTSYQRMMEISEGLFSEDPGMVAAILLNRECLKTIATLQEFLIRLVSIIEENDQEKVKHLFSEMREKFSGVLSLVSAG